ATAWAGPGGVSRRSTPDRSAAGLARKLPGWSWAPSRTSTRRTSASSRQTCRRNVERSRAGFSRARWNSSSSFMTFLPSGRNRLLCLLARNREKKHHAGGWAGEGKLSAAADLGLQPGAGEGPVAVGRARRDAEDLGGLLAGQPGEVAQLDQPRLDRVGGGQLV